MDSDKSSAFYRSSVWRHVDYLLTSSPCVTDQDDLPEAHWLHSYLFCAPTGAPDVQKYKSWAFPYG